MKPRPINQYSMDGKYLETYESAAEAGRFLKSHRTYIAECANGGHPHAKGFRWKWRTDELNKNLTKVEK